MDLKKYYYRGKLIDISGVKVHIERGDLNGARSYLVSKKMDIGSAEGVVNKIVEEMQKSTTSEDTNFWKQEKEKTQKNAQRIGAAFYEYKVLSLLDKDTGICDVKDVETQLNRLAQNGWRVISSNYNELGKNAVSILGFGINSTVGQTIIILERDTRLLE